MTTFKKNFPNKMERIHDPYYVGGRNIEQVEVGFPIDDVDAFLEHYGGHPMGGDMDDVTRQYMRRKHDKIMYKVFKAASLVLTDRQWQIFNLRWIANQSQTDISHQLSVRQHYVSVVLQACNRKILKAFRLDPKKPKKRKHRRIRRSKTNSPLDKSAPSV